MSLYTRAEYEHDILLIGTLKNKVLQAVADGLIGGIEAKPILDDLDAEEKRANTRLRMTSATIQGRKQDRLKRAESDPHYMAGRADVMKKKLSFKYNGYKEETK